MIMHTRDVSSRLKKDFVYATCLKLLTNHAINSILKRGPLNLGFLNRCKWPFYLNTFDESVPVCKVDLSFSYDENADWQ